MGNTSSDLSAPSSIKVSDAFEIKNGLSGMITIIFLHICRLLGNRIITDGHRVDQTFRTLIGLCRESLKWKTNAYFVNNRKKFIFFSVPFRHNSAGKCVFAHTKAGEQCKIVGERVLSVFMDLEIVGGIVRWTLRPNYKTDKSIRCVVGAVASEMTANFDGATIGRERGSCAFWFKEVSAGTVQTGLYGPDTDGYDEFAVMSVPAQRNPPLISLEIDGNNRTMAFFVEGKMVPSVLTNVPIPARLGVSARAPHSITSISFRRLARATPFASACTLYECLAKNAPQSTTTSASRYKGRGTPALIYQSSDGKHFY